MIYYSSVSPSSLITESVCLVGKGRLKEKCGLEPRTNFFFSLKKSSKLVQIRFGCGLDSRIYGIRCHESDVWSKALTHSFTSSNLMWIGGSKILSVATRASWITLCVPGVNCFLAGHSLWRNAGQILRRPRDRQNKNAWCTHCVYIEAPAPAPWISREHPKFNVHSRFSPNICCHSLVLHLVRTNILSKRTAEYADKLQPRLLDTIKWQYIKSEEKIFLQGPPKKCVHTSTKENSMLYVSTKFNYTSQVQYKLK